MKTSDQVLRKPSFETFWEIPNRPLNVKCMVPAFLGDQFAGNEAGLRTYKQSSEEFRGLQGFSYTAGYAL